MTTVWLNITMYCYVNSSVGTALKQATMVELEEVSGKCHQSACSSRKPNGWNVWQWRGTESNELCCKAAIMTGKLTWRRVYELSYSNICVWSEINKHVWGDHVRLSVQPCHFKIMQHIRQNVEANQLLYKQAWEK
jgi:hypothetical protein